MAALGATCRALRAAAADGEVWRALLRRAFPASPLTCASLADYRLAYQVGCSFVLLCTACAAFLALESLLCAACSLLPGARRHRKGSLVSQPQLAPSPPPDLPLPFVPRPSPLPPQLEANGVVPELCCFYSRASFETEVLGFPYQVR